MAGHRRAPNELVRQGSQEAVRTALRGGIEIYGLWRRKRWADTSFEHWFSVATQQQNFGLLGVSPRQEVS